MFICLNSVFRKTFYGEIKIYSITKFRKRLFSPFLIQVPVVQTLGSVFQRISHYTADKYILGKKNCVIHWIDIYLVDNLLICIASTTAYYILLLFQLNHQNRNFRCYNERSSGIIYTSLLSTFRIHGTFPSALLTPSPFL